MNINYEKITNEDIIYFWENFIFTSIYSSQKNSKKTPKYQNYISNNNVLSTFQVAYCVLKIARWKIHISKCMLQIACCKLHIAN